MASIKFRNVGRRGLTPGVVRQPVRLTLHPVCWQALLAQAVARDCPVGLVLDDFIARILNIPLEQRLPHRPEDGPQVGPALGSAPRPVERKADPELEGTAADLILR
jgi:hypothetical protein